MEGFWGFLITTFVFLPIFQNVDVPDFSEDSYETWYMLNHTSSIFYATIFYVIVILAYNVTAMMVTQQFTAVHRTILEAMRTLCIWIVNLFIYYQINTSFGEQWTGWSYFELIGFGLLLFGLFIYNEVIQLPWLPDYQEILEARDEAQLKRPPELGKKGGAQLPPMSPFIRSPHK